MRYISSMLVFPQNQIQNPAYVLYLQVIMLKIYEDKWYDLDYLNQFDHHFAFMLPQASKQV